MLLAWFGARALILNKIERLLAVTRQVHDGDLTARTGFAPGREELSRLGASIDEMVQTLQDRDERLSATLKQLAEQATTDPLTGLNNRRSLQKQLDQELVRAGRGRHSLAVILLDIDHFKRFNDTWGHQAGDEVLKRVAEVIRKGIRTSDIAGRYGGEELITILPEATAQAALARAEAMRREIEAQQLEHAGDSLGSVTASFGVAVFPDHGNDSVSLIRAADDALYEAKTAGRNRVVVSGRNQPATVA
jgi:diguanylate cyclase (GGDEF)-like protein